MPGSNERLSPGERKVMFGKHCGKTFKELPENYLRWMCDKAFKAQKRKRGGVDTARVRWAREELKRRYGL